MISKTNIVNSFKIVHANIFETKTLSSTQMRFANISTDFLLIYLKYTKTIDGVI